jgi:hypothetical protein
MNNFDAVGLESDKRLRDAKKLLDLVVQIERSPGDQELVKVLKGSFFVLLYGALEKTVFYLVNQCIQILNSKHEKLLDLKPVLWALVFNDECTAIHDAGDKKWTKRWELFSQVNDGEAKQMDDVLFPSSGGNIQLFQIEGIWRTFGISTPARMNERIATRLSNLADNRMKVAHGRESASSVGAGYTAADLNVFYSEVRDYITYLICCFESYIDNQEYKV